MNLLRFTRVRVDQNSKVVPDGFIWINPDQVLAVWRDYVCGEQFATIFVGPHQFSVNGTAEQVSNELANFDELVKAK